MTTPIGGNLNWPTVAEVDERLEALDLEAKALKKLRPFLAAIEQDRERRGTRALPRDESEEAGR